MGIQLKTFFYLPLVGVLLVGCLRGTGESSMTDSEITEMLESRFNFEFPQEVQVLDASLFSERSGWVASYARLAIRTDAFASFRLTLGERMLFLGDSTWGDRPIRDGLKWWKAHENEHKAKFSIMAKDYKQDESSSFFLTTRDFEKDQLEIYLYAKWKRSSEKALGQ